MKDPEIKQYLTWRKTGLESKMNFVEQFCLELVFKIGSYYVCNTWRDNLTIKYIDHRETLWNFRNLQEP